MQQDNKLTSKLVFGRFQLDADDEVLLLDDERVSLAPKEFHVLRLLVANAGHLVRKETIVNTVWPNTFVSDSSLLRTVSVLRRHLGYDAIRTVPKRGYVFALPVEPVHDLPVPQNGHLLIEEKQYAATALGDAGFSAGISLVPEESRDDDSLRASRVIAGRNPSLRTQMLVAAALIAAVLASAEIVGTGDHSRGILYAMTNRWGMAKNSSNPSGAARIFVLNEGARTLSVLNTLTNSIETTVPLEGDPRGAESVPYESSVYITVNSTNRVAVLDNRTNRLKASIPVGSSPVGIAVNPRPPFIYVANNYSNTVSIIDSRTNTVTGEIPVGRVPTEIAVAPDGSRAIVSNQSDGTVTLIDAVANVSLGTIQVGAIPVGVAISRDSQFGWVTLTGQNEVAVIDLASREIIRRLPVRDGPIRIAMTKDGRYALVSSFYSNRVTFVDTSAFRGAGEVEVGTNPVGITFDPPGRLAYVVNYGSNDVSVVDIAEKKVVRVLPVGAKPVEMAVLPCYMHACS